MASPDQNLSTLLQRIKSNKLNIKNMKFEDLQLKLNTLPIKTHVPALINLGGAVAFFVIKNFLAGFYQLAPATLSFVLLWSTFKPYFSNTKLRKLLDTPLTFVTKKKLDQNIPQAPSDAVPLILDKKYSPPLKKSLTQLKTDESQWAQNIDDLKKRLEFQQAKNIKIEEIKMPKSLTFDELIILLNDRKKAEEYFKIENHPGVYFDLSQESKQIVGQALRELNSQQTQNKISKFIKDYQSVGVGIVGGGLTALQIKDKEAKALKEKILKEDQDAAEPSKPKQRAPNPLDIRKKNPKKFGG